MSKIKYFAEFKQPFIDRKTLINHSETLRVDFVTNPFAVEKLQKLSTELISCYLIKFSLTKFLSLKMTYKMKSGLFVK